MTRSVPKKLGALTLAAVMTLAACGSDGEDTSTPAETTEAAAEVGTIVDVAAGNPDFSTLRLSFATSNLALIREGVARLKQAL